MSRLLTYSYPPFDITIGSKVHQDIKRIKSAVRKWAFHFKLCGKENEKKYIVDDIVRLACVTYPSGDFERTVLLAKFMVHVFILDDVILDGKEGPFFRLLMKHDKSYENTAALFDKAIEDKATPVAVAFTNFWEQMKGITNETWQNRFAGNYIWYLKANIWEEQNMNANRVPPLDEYLEYRHYSSGVDPSLNLIEFSRNIFIPDSVFVNPTLQRLNHIAGNVIALLNDVFSFEKERKVGEINNLVTVLKYEYDISYQKAIEMAVKMVNEEMKKYMALEPFIPSFGIKMDKYVNMYLEGLKDWMFGNHNWSCSCRRYIRFAYPKDQF